MLNRDDYRKYINAAHGLGIPLADAATLMERIRHVTRNARRCVDAG